MYFRPIGTLRLIFRPVDESNEKLFPRIPFCPLHGTGRDRDGSFVELRGWWLAILAPFVRLAARRNWKEDTDLFR